jgi:hypothetical protein
MDGNPAAAYGLGFSFCFWASCPELFWNLKLSFPVSRMQVPS